jgi:hypothetical protein
VNDDKYKEYFLSNEEIWYDYLHKAKKFMDKNDKRPNSHSKNEDEKKLGSWIGNQLQNYKKNICIMKEIFLIK